MARTLAPTPRRMHIHHARCRWLSDSRSKTQRKITRHAAMHARSSLSSPDNPCTRGEIVQMLSSRWIPLCALTFSFSLPPLASSQTLPDDSVRMNQIQVMGSHNSYHAGIAPSEAILMRQKNPARFETLEYKHRPLEEQLSSGIRQIELDVYADSQGGRFADPLGPKIVAQAGLSADPPFDPEGIMKKPGFKVMHVQDYDYRSTCQPFAACLEIVRRWSQ